MSHAAFPLPSPAPPAHRPTVHLCRALIPLFVALTLGAPGAASAAKPKGEAPLHALPSATLRELAPWLALGDLVLLESKPDGTLAQVTHVSRVPAPAAGILEVLSEPQGFPKLVPSMVRCEVRRRDDGVSEISWEMEIPFQNPEGRMLFFDERPKAIRYHPVDGTVSYGAWRWEALPLGPADTIVAHYNTADVSDVSWIVRRFLAAWPTFEHGSVASTGIVFLKAVAAEAIARFTGKARQKPRYVSGRPVALRPLVRGERQPPLAAIEPLLERGRVALIEYDGRGQLQQCSIISRIAAPPDQVAAIAGSPRRYPEFVPSVSKVDVVSESDGMLDLVQTMSMPLVELKLNLRMKRSKRRIAMKAMPGGDLPTSVTGWDFVPSAKAGATTALYYTCSDPGEVSWFVKKLLQREPYFSPGLNLAMGLVVARAVQDRAEGRPSKP